MSSTARISSRLSAIDSARRFSRRCASEVVPGIGRDCGDHWSCQASAICRTLAPCAAAIGGST
jgi:hypothetical protein